MTSEELRRRIEDVKEDIRHASYTVPYMKEKNHPDWREMKHHLIKQTKLLAQLVQEEQDAMLKEAAQGKLV